VGYVSCPHILISELGSLGDSLDCLKEWPEAGRDATSSMVRRTCHGGNDGMTEAVGALFLEC